jgi:glucosamine 6-phosphate synthetase-like amidotransferase/phosphosugar isomerase protein
MCGVFGFAAKENEPVDLRILKRIAAITESRGPHAWGMAWVDGRGKMRSYKQSGRITDAMGLLDMAKDARMLIGHCRWATHGDPANNLNNHPHDGGDAWVVHNGVIYDYERIAKKHRLWMSTECDSEVLGLMLRDFAGKPYQRFRRVVKEAKGIGPFVMLALWPDRLMAARENGQPLHEGRTDDAYYLASLPAGLPGKVRAIPEGHHYEIADEKENEV